MKLRVFFKEEPVFNVKFIQTACTFHTNFGEIVTIRDFDAYEGPYNVIPRVYQQVLETNNKLMEDDVTVEIIPLNTVLNISNGYTATIG